MKATALKANRPDVELRLTAEEADRLKTFFRDLTLSEIEESLAGARSRLGEGEANNIYQTTVEIYEALEDLDY